MRIGTIVDMKIFSPAPARNQPISCSLNRRCLLVAVACGLLCLGRPALAEEGHAAKTVRLLTVGNSFSANATNFLDELAEADGNKLIHRPIVVGGSSLELHATKSQQFEREPNSKDGLYSNGRSLKEQLRMDRWDFVTIQQASIKSHDVSTYRPYAAELRDYIKQQAPQAEVLLHETWEYRCDDPRFAVSKPKPGEPPTQDAMYQGLSAACSTIAHELGIRRIPVGDAFHLADTDAQWGFRPNAHFDAKGAKPPELPGQAHSLHVGWNWSKPKDGTPKLTFDGHHASVAGEYLGACVWYEVLFGRSAVGNPFVPAGLDADYARFLQQTAHRAVSEVSDAAAQSTPAQ